MWWLFLLLTQAHASGTFTWTPLVGTNQTGNCSNTDHIHAAMCGLPKPGCPADAILVVDALTEGVHTLPCPSGQVGSRTATCLDGTTTVQNNCRPLSDFKDASNKQAAREDLKSRQPDEAKATKKPSYASAAERKDKLKAAKNARRAYMKAQHEALGGGDAWKDLVVEDTDDFEGYSDAVLAKRQAKGLTYKIRYRAAPANLPCSFTTPDLTLTKEEGIDVVDPETCVTIGVVGEPGVIKMTKNGDFFDLECNDGPNQAGLDIGSNFTCQGRVWDIGSASTDVNDVSGCTDSTACNYDSSATVDDGECVYATGCDLCSGEQDGTGTVVDKDADDDGVCDDADAFPNDATETTDSDVDGVGDNADAFPNDATETTDSDVDGVGDNADAFPNDPTESADSDGDGLGNNADTISGCKTATACNYNPSATVNHDDALCDIADSTLCQTCVDGASQVTFDADDDGVCDDVDTCIGGNCVEDKVEVQYDGQRYEACQGATVKVIKNGNHNIWEGIEAVIEPLSTSPVTTTLLGAPKGTTRTFYCSAHPTLTFQISCCDPEYGAEEYINNQCCGCL